MALPVIYETSSTDLADTLLLSEVADNRWDEVEETSINSLLAEILGYEPTLISDGATTVPDPDAAEVYNTLMHEVLGYVLEEPAEIRSAVREAIDEIAAGRTRVAYSTTELDEQLRGPEPTDD